MQKCLQSFILLINQVIANRTPPSESHVTVRQDRHLGTALCLRTLNGLRIVL